MGTPSSVWAPQNSSPHSNDLELLSSPSPPSPSHLSTSSSGPMSRGGGGYKPMSTDTAAFAALLNELRGPLTGVAA
eukprot:674777-Rhodomonas_salina.2